MPEAAVGGGLAIVRTGDRIRIDLSTNRANMLVPEKELVARRAALAEAPYPVPASQTPWQEKSTATSSASSMAAR